MKTLKIEELSKNFGSTEVLRKINLEIDEGNFLVLLGPSGCGKSTLLNIIAGLETINEGNVYIDDYNVSKVEPKDRNIAMVFQSYALYPHMTVYNNMAFGLKLEKLGKTEIDERVYDAAKILQIEELLQRKPRQLSGGQRQRVAIGRAITRKPKVFLFDEPLSNLDAALRVQMRVELAKLHDQLDATMIYVTHDQTEAMTMADKIVVLNEGRVSQSGEPMKLYKSPDNLFVAGFIGSPKMNFIPVKVLDKDKNKTKVDLLGVSDLTISKGSNAFEKSDSLTLGIRPEHLTVNKNAKSFWKGKVFVVEKLGSGTFLYLEKDGDPLVVETDGDSRIKVGDIVRVGFDPKKCHLFDPSNTSIK